MASLSEVTPIKTNELTRVGREQVYPAFFSDNLNDKLLSMPASIDVPYDYQHGEYLTKKVEPEIEFDLLAPVVSTIQLRLLNTLSRAGIQLDQMEPNTPVSLQVPETSSNYTIYKRHEGVEVKFSREYDAPHHENPFTKSRSLSRRTRVLMISSPNEETGDPGELSFTQASTRRDGTRVIKGSRNKLSTVDAFVGLTMELDSFVQAHTPLELVEATADSLSEAIPVAA